MTILVTGASGFVGRRLVNALLRQNKKVRILVRKPPTNFSKIDLSKVEVRIGDITKKDSISEIMDGIEIVYHCAAKLGAGRREDFYSVNLDGTDNLLQEAVHSGVNRFVHVSSVSVMSEYRDHFGSNEDEKYASWWTEPYTPSKVESEKTALRYSRNLKIVVIRPGWIWGPGDINTFNISKAIMAGFIPSIGNGENILSLTYIMNVIHALLLAGDVNCTSGEVFLINDGQRVTQKLLLGALADRLNPDARSISIPFSLAYQISHIYEIINRSTLWKLPGNISRHNTCVAAKNFEFSLEKAKRILHFYPPISFSDGIDETVKWFYDMKLEKNSKKFKTSPKSILGPVLGRTAMAHFAITSWCNAKCVFCSYPDSKERVSVDLSDAIKAINALKLLGVGIISLTGGEPFLNRDIFRIACHASSVGMVVFTGTNGSLMTKEDVSRLSNSGVHAIWISYEGPQDGVFDENRGISGLSKMIRQNLKWLRNAGINTFAICVLNKSIIDYRQFIDHLIDVGFDKVKFDYPMTQLESSYLGFKDLELIKYTCNEIEEVIRQIIELKRSKYRSFGIINPISGLEGAIDFFKGRKNHFGCAAGHRILYLDWNLDLYRCTRLPEKFGKVWEVSPQQLHRTDCNKCYYQGTRDYDSIYYLLDSVNNGAALARQGDLLGALHSVINKNNLAGLSSMFEIASS